MKTTLFLAGSLLFAPLPTAIPDKETAAKN
jgi:hypothetical protein